MKRFAILSVFFLWGGYAASQTVVSVDAKQIINEGYIGNGAQWDPYQLDYGKGRLDISETDWKKMYDRLDFMRPQFIRVMTNTTSVMQDGVLYPERGLEHLSHILDYCQSRDVTVMFGDWGGGMVDARKEVIREKNLSAAAEYVRFLIEEKGYSCIKYYNLVNEPNGYWSSTDGKYSLWARAIRFFYGELQKNKLHTGNFGFVIFNVREPGIPRDVEDGAGMSGINSGLKAPPGILREHDRAAFDFGAQTFSRPFRQADRQGFIFCGITPAIPGDHIPSEQHFSRKNPAAFIAERKICVIRHEHLAVFHANISQPDIGHDGSLKRTNHAVIVSGAEDFFFRRSTEPVQKALRDDRHTRAGVKQRGGAHVPNLDVYKQQICKAAARQAICHWLISVGCSFQFFHRLKMIHDRLCGAMQPCESTRGFSHVYSLRASPPGGRCRQSRPRRYYNTRAGRLQVPRACAINF